jgi:hypothetical protein
MTVFRDGAAGPGLFPAMGPELRRDMDALFPLIEKTFPIPARFRRDLASGVAELSRLLTSARGERPLSYLNRPPMLSAYLRYFLPWNLYRLCRLLPSLELPLAPGDRILDLGAGPLTFPIALWLCRPEFRDLPLEFSCTDLSRAALDAGKRLFTALGGGPPCPWTIRLHGAGGRGPRNPAQGTQGASLVAVFNMYNELFQSISPGDAGGLHRLAETQGAFLASRAGKDGRVLIVEPGIPRSGQFITLLREALTDLGYPPLSPCAHDGPCPFPGPDKGGGPRKTPGLHRPAGQRRFPEPGGSPAGGDPAARDTGKGASKWCHFAFDTQDAPAALRRLSTAAGLPKERATLSFLLAGPAPGDRSPGRGALNNRGPLPPLPGDRENPRPQVRIISDPFPLGAAQGPREWGRYGCAKEGMTLVQGERPLIESLPPGALVRVVFTGRRDSKSGALLCRPAGAE